MTHEIPEPSASALALQLRTGESLDTHAALLLWVMGSPKYRKDGLTAAVSGALGLKGGGTLQRYMKGEIKKAPDWPARISVADREGDIEAGRVALAFWKQLHEARLGMEPVKALHLRGMLRFASLDDELAKLRDPERRRLAKQAEDKAAADRRRRVSVQDKIERVERLGDAILGKLAMAITGDKFSPKSNDFKMVVETWRVANEIIRKEQADLEAPTTGTLDPLAGSVRVAQAVATGDRDTILSALERDAGEILLAAQTLRLHEQESNVRPSERRAG